MILVQQAVGNRRRLNHLLCSRGERNVGRLRADCTSTQKAARILRTKNYRIRAT